VHRYLRRHQDLLVFSFRFYYGLRTVTPFAIGSAQVSPLRFSMLNFASAVLWTSIFVFAGYFLGGATEHLVAEQRYVPYAIAGTVLLVFIVLVAMRMRRRSRASL
jgi:membrane protein DedA with SNARE-associated domain